MCWQCLKRDRSAYLLICGDYFSIMEMEPLKSDWEIKNKMQRAGCHFHVDLD